MNKKRDDKCKPQTPEVILDGNDMLGEGVVVTIRKIPPMPTRQPG